MQKALVQASSSQATETSDILLHYGSEGRTSVQKRRRETADSYFNSPHNMFRDVEDVAVTATTAVPNNGSHYFRPGGSFCQRERPRRKPCPGSATGAVSAF